MPSLVKIKVVSARDLNNESSQGGTGGKKKGKTAEAFTDSYVNITLGNQEQQRTQTMKKTSNPIWDEEFRFEVVDDSMLQSTPLEFKVIDQDLYSSELIGVVYIDLNPLIMRTAHAHGTSENAQKDLVIEGWFPLYDTLRGIQGSLYVVVKLQFIGNDNPFRDSSAGVQFFSSNCLSAAEFIVQDVLGLVTDLVVEDDPEMSWADYFRAAKSSNDSRLRVLYRLSARVRKEVGKKVLEAGGNAVLGYSSHFDMEGVSGIVVRAYGTACRLMKVHDLEGQDGQLQVGVLERERDGVGGSGITFSGINLDGSTSYSGHHPPIPILLSEHSGLLASSSPTSLLTHHRSANSLTHRANSRLFTNTQGAGGAAVRVLVPFGPASESKFGGQNWDTTPNYFSAASNTLGGPDAIAGDDEIQILSLKSFEPHVRIRYGGLVMAKSVKFLGKLASSLSDQETREGWWEEIRDELKSHALSLCCTHIIGYSELCTIYGDVCVLTCTGTAATMKGFVHPSLISAMSNVASGSGGANINTFNSGVAGSPVHFDQLQPITFDSTEPLDTSIGFDGKNSKDVMSVLSDSDQHYKTSRPLFAKPSSSRKSRAATAATSSSNKYARSVRPCSVAHVPYNRNRAPFSFMRLVPCLMCQKRWVPEYLLTSVEPPDSLPVKGKSRLLEVVVHRSRKKQPGGELDAVKMSEMLPFIEFDLQRQIMLKLKVYGMNAVFGYTSSLQFGASIIIATATCTAVYLEALPPPQSLQISRNIKDMNLKLSQETHLSQIQTRIEAICQQNKLIMDSAKSSIRDVPASKRLKKERADKGVAEPQHQDPDDSDDHSSSSSSDSSSSSSSSSSSDGEYDSSSLENPSIESSSSSSSSSDSDSDENKSEEKKESNSLRRRDRSKSSMSEDSGSHVNSSRKKSVGVSSSRSFAVQKNSAKKKKKKRVLFEDDRRPYVVEIDEETDSDMMTLLSDRALPLNMDIVNIQHLFPYSNATSAAGLRELTDSRSEDETTASNQVSASPAYEMKEIKVMRRVKIPTSTSSRGGINHLINQIFQDAYARLCFPLRSKIPCEILGLSHRITVLDDATIEIFFTAESHYSSSTSTLASGGKPALSSMIASVNKLSLALLNSAAQPGLKPLIPLEAFAFKNFQPHDDIGGNVKPTLKVNSSAYPSLSSTALSITEDPPECSVPLKAFTAANHSVANVILTYLSYIPGRRIIQYLGPLQLHFIKESWGMSDKNLLGTFFYIFQSEIDAAARAQVVALGGNALICHKIVPLESGSSVSRNQVYNMISIYGDVVLISQ